MTSLPQTPEAVAYALLQDIARAEDVDLAVGPGASGPGNRKWILETFSECLKCVKADGPKANPTHGRSSF